MTQDVLPHLLAEIDGHRRLRTPSLLITVFGDCIVPRGGAISARSLAEICRPLGIEDGALRTALSRLASDGWIIRERQGRNAFYRLSEAGLKPFAVATERIYAPSRPVASPGDIWLLAQLPPNTAWPDQFFDGQDAVIIDPRTALVQNSDSQLKQALNSENALLLSGSLESMPEWVRALAMPEAMARDAQYLKSVFEIAASHPPTDPLNALATRLLLIHEWRRICLRWPVVPRYFQEISPLRPARQFVGQLYQQLLSQSENWLNDHASGPDGPLRSVQDLTARFRLMLQ